MNDDDDEKEEELGIGADGTSRATRGWITGLVGTIGAIELLIDELDGDKEVDEIATATGGDVEAGVNITGLKGGGGDVAEETAAGPIAAAIF